jgi:hypothetical protein
VVCSRIDFLVGQVFSMKPSVAMYLNSSRRTDNTDRCSEKKRFELSAVSWAAAFRQHQGWFAGLGNDVNMVKVLPVPVAPAAWSLLFAFHVSAWQWLADNKPVG